MKLKAFRTTTVEDEPSRGKPPKVRYSLGKSEMTLKSKVQNATLSPKLKFQDE